MGLFVLFRRNLYLLERCKTGICWVSPESSGTVCGCYMRWAWLWVRVALAEAGETRRDRGQEVGRVTWVL